MNEPPSPLPGPSLLGPAWDGDVLGNVFVGAWNDSAAGPAKLDGTLALPTQGTYLVRGGSGGESYQASFSGSFVADQTGGVYRFGALSATLNLGCGPMVPTSPSSTYLARLGPTWSCTYAHVLPAAVSVLADANGGAILAATSTSSLDLGCGTLAAASGGSTFVTHLDPSGACVFGKSLPAPNLTVALDPSGNVVLSGLVGPTAVDLGGGPLAPLGSQDFVLAELDASGNFLWGQRFGGAGIACASPRVSTSASGNVYVLTGWNGAVDLGGGPLSATTRDTVVGSFSSSGAYRWARAYDFSGAVASIDGCGSLVVATRVNYLPGCGSIFPPPFPCAPSATCSPAGPDTAIARFAP